MIKTSNLSENVWLHEIKNSKFKINKISINLVVPFVPENASNLTALSMLLIKQCKKWPSALLLGQKLKSLYGADLDSDCSKFGDFQTLSFSICTINNEFALNNEPLFEQAFDLLCEIVFNPKTENNKLNQKDVAIEKQNLIELISGHLSDKQKLAQINATKLLFENENYAHPSFGSIESAQQISQDVLTEAYENLLKISQIHIMAVGQINSENLKSTILKHTHSLSRQASFDFKNSQFVLPAQFKLKQQSDFDTINQSKLILGFASKTEIDADLMPAIRTMTAIFGATPTSKLFSVVREKLSLCYFCAAKLDVNKKVLWVFSGVDEKNLKMAETSILEQLEEIKNGAFSTKDLQESKQWLVDNLNLIDDDVNQLENFYLRKILLNNKNSIDAEIEALNKLDSNQIEKAANLFHHALTYALVSKN